jgi:hypothetical protein
MSLQAIKARIAQVVGAVQDVKNVHDHAVYAKDAEQENALLREGANADGRIHCWTGR